MTHLLKTSFLLFSESIIHNLCWEYFLLIFYSMDNSRYFEANWSNFEMSRLWYWVRLTFFLRTLIKQLRKSIKIIKLSLKQWWTKTYLFHLRLCRCWFRETKENTNNKLYIYVVNADNKIKGLIKLTTPKHHSLLSIYHQPDLFSSDVLCVGCYEEPGLA